MELNHFQYRFQSNQNNYDIVECHAIHAAADKTTRAVSNAIITH